MKKTVKILCLILSALMILSALPLTASGAEAIDPVTCGDVDGDGTITLQDVRLAMRQAIKLENYKPGSREYLACDSDGDGATNILDARLILMNCTTSDDKPLSDINSYSLEATEVSNGKFTVSVIAHNTAGKAVFGIPIAYDPDVLSIKSKDVKNGPFITEYNSCGESILTTYNINTPGVVLPGIVLAEEFFSDAEWADICADNDIIPTVNTEAVTLFTMSFSVDDSSACKTTITCGNSSVDVEISHQWDDGKIIINPSCQEEGIMEYTCLICGITEEETLETTGHNWDDGVIIKEPTCTSKGVRLYSCSVCNAAKMSYIDKLTAHIPCAPVKENEIAATCKAAGSYDEVVYCVSCNAEISRESKTVDKLTTHTWNEGTVTIPAKCTERGELTFVCEVCGETKNENIASLGHLDADGDGICDVCESALTVTESHQHTYTIDYVAPTCTTDGIIVLTCECGETSSKTLAKTGHNYVDFVIEPTCTADGYTKHYCVNCGDELIDTVVNAVGHSMYVQTIVPTCTENGCDILICESCGYNYSANETKAPGHQLSVMNAAAPTAEQDGYTGDVVCTVCRETLEKGMVIPATGSTDSESEECTHLCHKDGFLGFIWKIVNLFNKLFKINQSCECGARHW